MAGAGAGGAARQNLSSFRNILTQASNILVVDGLDTVNTESANLLAAFSDIASRSLNLLSLFHEK
jgi:hypothetical protein